MRKVLDWSKLHACGNKCLFPRLIKKSIISGECFVYIAQKNEHRPKATYLSATDYVYRHAYTHYYNTPIVYNVLHTCDNERCWNPHHLYDGTTQENSYDYWSRVGVFLGPTGEVHPNYKYKDAEIHQIKVLYWQYKLKIVDIADIFGINRGTVWRYIHEVWRKDIPRDNEHLGYSHIQEV